jgi:branched-chain amino acid transport system permease protein
MTPSPRLRRLAGWAALAGGLALFPFITSSSFWLLIATVSLLYAMIAASWDVTFGYAGILNFAHPACFGVGAYAVAIISTRYTGVSPWIALVAGPVAGACAAAIAFLPTMRLKGIYVALITFIFGQLLRQLVLSQTGLTGGSSGIVELPPLHIGSYQFYENGGLGYYAVAAAFAFLVLLVLRRVASSDFGHSLLALRDAEDYAASRGISVRRQRLIAFLIGGAVAGLAGGVYGIYLGVVSPELFDFGYLTLILSMMLVGGVATILGPALGAFLITYATNSLASSGPWRSIVLSVLILVVLWFCPGGLLGGSQSLIRVIRAARYGSSGTKTVPTDVSQAIALPFGREE